MPSDEKIDVLQEIVDCLENLGCDVEVHANLIDVVGPDEREWQFSVPKLKEEMQ